MNNAEQILVIIVSATLTLFLVVSILVLVKVLKVLDQIKRIGDHAEQVAENVEHTSEYFQKAAGPMAILKVIGNLAETFNKTKRRR